METKVVRVAFPTQEGMSFFGHSGKVTGYNYDYLEKISEYTGWEMEYVPYASADGNEAVGSAINDLMEGNVDLLGPLLKNEATEEMFDFPEHSYGTVYTTLCALSASNLRENNLHQQDLIKVGLWEKAEVRNGEVIAYLDSENLSYEITYYDSADAQHQALIDGSVDAISSVSLSPIANSRIIAQFAARPYYFATTKGNKEFIDQLDETIVKINRAESKLQEALQIAREANQSKTTFLSNMSHDIRTPMNAVLGLSTLLAKEPGNETKVREYARKITAAGNHLLGLINDILDISKIESGKVTLHQSVFSLDELLESINVVIRPMAGAKRQSFQINVGKIEHELFVGDKVRINQVLINLLSNAVKYTPVDGHIEFNIKDLGNSSTSFVSMQFQVKDDGYGITEELSY